MMRRRLRLGRINRESGQASFEFALLLPVFVFAVLLVVDGGVWMYKFVSVSNAVREGARFGAVCASTCDAGDVEMKVVDSSGNIISLSDFDPGDVRWVARGGSGTDKGDSIVVHVSQEHDLLFFPFSFSVSSCAEMRLEAANGTSGLPTGAGC